VVVTETADGPQGGIGKVSADFGEHPIADRFFLDDGLSQDPLGIDELGQTDNLGTPVFLEGHQGLILRGCPPEIEYPEASIIGGFNGFPE